MIRIHMRLLALGGALLLLTGCSGGGSSAPAEYAIGEDRLPALGGEDAKTLKCTAQLDEETQMTSYVYSGLESGSETAQAYVDTLLAEWSCSVIDENGVKQPEPTLSEESGELLVGKNTTDESGIFSLDLQWSADSCTVTPAVLEGETVTEQAEVEEALTVEEAVARIEQLPAEKLGLEEVAGEYSAYSEDGYVMVDDKPCFRINCYDKEGRLLGTYLLSTDGKSLYQLDREQDQVSLIGSSIGVSE